MYPYKQEKVKYLSEGSTITALLYTPERAGKLPAIVMAHGYGLTKEAYIDRFAERFAAYGFVVVLFDYRNFGESEGLPRQEVNPFLQIDDFKNSITFATTLSYVDAEKIGIWGTSYAGGNVIVTAATDRRVKCVVAQVPTISGYENTNRKAPAEKSHLFWKAVQEDRIGRLHGKEAMMKKLVGRPEDNPIYPTQESRAYYEGAIRLSPYFKNEVTFRSTEYSRMYEPGVYITQISPTPLLMVVALTDVVTPTDLILKAYERALEPKKLFTVQGGHFSVYLDHFEQTSQQAVDFFLEHLT
ncbi:alpha/beta hydrolase [Spirosoma humi]